MPIKTRQLQASVGADRPGTTTLQLPMTSPAIPGHLKVLESPRPDNTQGKEGAVMREAARWVS